ncbi:M28 family metallopeptidase [Aggregatilinea lenta]|uniref:M28 family metallopeptidase n=1 Tax=Aggregatilinea lenta TaxID=913108 RepID=UPI0013C32766|nr:M20/M25/M40 family metallo-hydrolase [Aggregatilinea lenta]
MFRQRFIVTALMVVALLLPSAVQAQGLPDFVAVIDTEDVMSHVRALSVAIGARPMGGEAEAQAAQYVAAAFADWGYPIDAQTFETTPPDESGTMVDTANVIATKPGGEQILVVGAHMDSVTSATGAGDNASGVAAMLAAAEALKDVPLDYTVMFVAFAAEEGGSPSGADVFVEGLGDQIDDVVAMINLDSVGVGTTLNVYAGAVITWPEDEDGAPAIEGGETWVRDTALDLAAELDLPFGTSPDDTWGGYTGDWSDHYAFVLADVPIAYFEAWQWDGAEDPWWGQETADGDVMHTELDSYDSVVPEKVEMTAELLAAMIAIIATGQAGPAA